MHVNPRHSRRQIPVADAGAGASTELDSSTAVVGTFAPGTDSLAFNTAATGVGAPTTIALVSESPTIVITTTSYPPSLSAAAATDAAIAPTATPASSGASHTPSMTTVIGACVGAFLGAAILIAIALHAFRRYTRAQEVAVRRRRAANAAAHNERKWAKLEKAPQSPPPRITSATLDVGAARLGVFPPSPAHSTFSASGAGSAEDAQAASDAALAAKFVAGQRAPAERAGPAPQSWGGESAGDDDSFLSLRTARMSGAMSPGLGAAKMTPPATVYGHLHAGEAAVVVDPFGEAAELARGGPVLAKPAPLQHRLSRKGASPFFAGGGGGGPFADAHAAKGRALGHRPALDSTTSTTSEATMQSLLAALDLPAGAPADGLRVASLQPSFVSAGSAYEDDVSPDEFPLPPAGSHR